MFNPERLLLDASCAIIAIAALWRVHRHVKRSLWMAAAYGSATTLSIYFLLASRHLIVPVDIDIVYCAMVFACTGVSAGRWELLVRKTDRIGASEACANDREAALLRNAAGLLGIVAYFGLEWLVCAGI